ncbi:MAG: DUF4910 domain-containing protein [Bacteroidales bacterium]|nr:DUF4910 domain-containing protein [Bacteroidales bacterium]
MKKQQFALTLVLSLFFTSLAAQEYTGPFWHSLMNEKVYDLIVGESSGDRAYYYIMDIAPYERDRKSSDYKGLFMESEYVVEKLKAAGFEDANTAIVGKSKTWDGVSAEVWEVSPNTAKLADYRDLAAILGQGSQNADVTAELVWVGRGSQAEIDAVDLKGKIAVTEASAGRVHNLAVKAGAVGIISYYSPRPLVDPIQIPNSGIRGGDNATFCINLTPRDGYALRDRLLMGEKITVKAKVETTTEETNIEVPNCVIKGTDENAEEIILCAHLFEGYVKLGANDNTSGSAALIEVARTLNELIARGQIERPKRSIRFIWIPEFQGSIPWAQQNKETLQKTLCNINLDMVGLWLSKSQSFYCLHRTTMGNPHYINDVAESFYHYMGATNKSFVATGMGRPDATKPVYSVTGSRDPFYYTINAHYGASDHEVFSDWGVQAPGVIMITWPDNYYHTSGDRPEICDPTQLHRAIVLAAASAYTVANADSNDAVKIATEVAANAAKRMSIKMKVDLTKLNGANAENFAALYRKARFNQDALLNNETATLATVLELAPESAPLKEFVAAMQESVKGTWNANCKSIDAAMKAKAAELGIAPLKGIVLSAAEKAASKVYPKSTAKVKEYGYGVLNSIPRETMAKYGFDRRGSVMNGAEIAKLTTTGTNSILDIKKMLDAQFPYTDNLETVTKYVEMLKEAGLVTY